MNSLVNESINQLINVEQNLPAGERSAAAADGMVGISAS